MTNIADFRMCLRFLLADRNASVQLFADTVLDDGVRTLILTNQMAGFTLTPDKSGIMPDFTDPNQFGLVCFKTAKLFILPNPDRYLLKSRAFTEANGGYQMFLQHLDNYIYRAESGHMFNGYQSFYGFLSGISGLSVAEVFTEMKVNAPFWTVTLTADQGLVH